MAKQLKNFIEQIWHVSIKPNSRITAENVQKQIRTKRDNGWVKLFQTHAYPTKYQINARRYNSLDPRLTLILSSYVNLDFVRFWELTLKQYEHAKNDLVLSLRIIFQNLRILWNFLLKLSKLKRYWQLTVGRRRPYGPPLPIIRSYVSQDYNLTSGLDMCGNNLFGPGNSFYLVPVPVIFFSVPVLALLKFFFWFQSRSWSR
jgi:hypothetical protein